MSYFSFEINITQKCTLACTYCFEDFNKKLSNIDPKILEEFESKIEYLINSEKFLNKYQGVNIIFWGGEPTMQSKILIKLMEKYIDEPKVKFFVYTNAYNLDNMFGIFEKYKDLKDLNNNTKLRMQISYDGAATHDIARVTKDNKPSSTKVKQNIIKLLDLGLNFHIKSVLSFNNINLLHKNYYEFRELNKKYPAIKNYLCSLDWFIRAKTLPDTLVEKWKKEITNQIKIILKDELEYYKQNNRFFLSWFGGADKACNAGASMNFIDIDGSIMPCHMAGSINEKSKKELIINNIFNNNEDFENKILETSEYYDSINFDSYPKECEHCFAKEIFCSRCHVKKYGMSEKESFYDKWNDFQSQDFYCDLFRHIAKLKLSLDKLTKENN